MRDAFVQRVLDAGSKHSPEDLQRAWDQMQLEAGVYLRRELGNQRRYWRSFTRQVDERKATHRDSSQGQCCAMEKVYPKVARAHK
jgi:hypothetical protein